MWISLWITLNGLVFGRKFNGENREIFFKPGKKINYFIAVLLIFMQADLNDFNNYEFAQIDKYQENEDGSLTITSEQEDPYMAFRTELLSE